MPSLPAQQLQNWRTFPPTIFSRQYGQNLPIGNVLDKHSVVCCGAGSSPALTLLAPLALLIIGSSSAGHLDTFLVWQHWHAGERFRYGKALQVHARSGDQTYLVADCLKLAKSACADHLGSQRQLEQRICVYLMWGKRPFLHVLQWRHRCVATRVTEDTGDQDFFGPVCGSICHQVQLRLHLKAQIDTASVDVTGFAGPSATAGQRHTSAG